MSYNAHQFGAELLAELNRGYDVVSIARWAHARYLCESRNASPDVQQKMMQVIAMEEDPAFELDEGKLRAFAFKLMSR